MQILEETHNVNFIGYHSSYQHYRDYFKTYTDACLGYSNIINSRISQWGTLMSKTMFLEKLFVGEVEL